MTTAKIAISIDREHLEKVHEAVRVGRAKSISAYIGRAIERQAREDSLREIVRDALIALDRGDKRMIALLQAAMTSRTAFRVPVGVVGQAWRNGPTQSVLARFLRSESVTVVALDGEHARACGELCAATRTSDVIDASVVLAARTHRDPIITSDIDDIRWLDPSSKLIAI